ncbi:glucuronyl hydrolase [Enterococcus sp. JM4C]|uniref:glycoside hydrolase family 88 protein n=1 Tax=Candidatus Enterococcus huntleyi TaxID=1857217 RepID=UPI00137B76DD|nr:glycoside hydrolase family 88 protein [Enterococcus sp. JM4C]KAF1299461.1 glucuronyl hydrolase [Enterococcus sp. JM4C]
MLTKKRIEQEIDFVYNKIVDNLEAFETKVPKAVSTNYIYPAVENADWTDGFWIGMLHLAQYYQPDPRIQAVITKQLAVFKKRLDEEIVLNHHDIGFLYSLSAIADYRENKTASSRDMALRAADVLMRRYNETAKVLQAWGDLSDKEQQGRMIIDCNMNLPLLYFASNETGNLIYRTAAENHVKLAQKYLIREDYSTFHTFYMDIETGEPRYGATAQGFSDDSCWSRGQAWGIYGFPISYTHTGDVSLLESASHLADYYLSHLPADKVAYWDLIFTEGSTEERDTSASAITVCGLLELAKHLPLTDERKKRYEEAAMEIMENLFNYTTKDYPESNGLLVQGVYSKPGGTGINECTTWGDYFYFEALIRLYKSWATYW